jgi:GNAT superfamily N-acetyltransferase
VVSGENNGQRTTDHGQRAQPVGYCIGHDQYFKRDDVGIIYQVNVEPGRQRGLIGAALVKAMFERAAYGCRLFCCWCAQDIEANRFWESLGFVPLAFRAGSRGKRRVHIFWQRRIRAGDETTPYWFPSQTSSGSIREDRLVFPIPPGVSWRDAMPLVLPEQSRLGILPEPTSAAAGRRKRSGDTPKPRQSPVAPTTISSGGLRLVASKPAEAPTKPQREPRPKVKNDPKLVAAARELRDRWLERVNTEPTVLSGASSKYDVSRALPGEPARVALPAPIAA